ncbi:MAG: hypothetical protein LBQ12_02575, partial [Deltaproteobacteria bacterium]|nr:hypothetical protein [Deltaproteobacteria bacterium]
MTDSPAPDGLAPGGGTVIPGDPGNAAGPADPEDPAAQPGAAGGPASPAAPQTGSAQQAGAAERADADAQTAAAPAPPRGASAGRPVRGRPPIKGQPAPAPPGPEAAAAPGTPAAAQATGAGGPGTAGGAAPPTGTVAPKAPERPASPNPPSAPPAAAPPAARPADGLLPAPAGAPDASPASPGAPNAFKNLLKVLKAAPPLALEGRVTRVAGLVIEGSGPAASVGEICLVDMPGGRILEAEAVGFKESAIQLMPIGDMTGLTPGSRIRATGGPARVDVGPGLLGRVLDGRGRPMDGKGPAEAEGSYPVRALPGSPMDRARILEPVDVGVRCINALLTLGRGQRVGIFAGSGVGKSTLMGMIARHMKADVNVIALVGE